MQQCPNDSARGVRRAILLVGHCLVLLCGILYVQCCAACSELVRVAWSNVRRLWAALKAARCTVLVGFCGGMYVMLAM